MEEHPHVLEHRIALLVDAPHLHPVVQDPVFVPVLPDGLRRDALVPLVQLLGDSRQLLHRREAIFLPLLRVSFRHSVLDGYFLWRVEVALEVDALLEQLPVPLDVEGKILGIPVG